MTRRQLLSLRKYLTNLTVLSSGPYFMTCALIPLLRKSDLRSVVIIASIAGLANQRYVSKIFPVWQYDADFELTSRAMGSVSYGVSKVSCF